MQFNFVRNELTAALLSFSKSHRNQIVAMAERAPLQSRFTAKPQREIDIDNDTVIVIDAEPISYREGKRYHTSMIPVSPAIFSQVSWRSALLKMPEPYKSWLNYCYGDSISFEHQTILTTHIWHSLLINLAESKSPKMNCKTETNLKALTWLALQESKNFINRGELKYSQEELSQLCGVKYDLWRKNYKNRWDVMLACGVQMDREALIHVDQLRKKHISNRR